MVVFIFAPFQWNLRMEKDGGAAQIPMTWNVFRKVLNIRAGAQLHSRAPRSWTTGIFKYIKCQRWDFFRNPSGGFEFFRTRLYKKAQKDPTYCDGNSRNCACETSTVTLIYKR